MFATSLSLCPFYCMEKKRGTYIYNYIYTFINTFICILLTQIYVFACRVFFVLQFGACHNVFLFVEVKSDADAAFEVHQVSKRRMFTVAGCLFDVQARKENMQLMLHSPRQGVCSSSKKTCMVFSDDVCH